MATKTLVLADVLQIDYDDVTNLITTVRVINDGSYGTITAALLDVSTNAVVYGPVTRPVGSGVTTQDISKAGVHMVLVPVPAKFGGGFVLALPFNVTIETGP